MNNNKLDKEELKHIIENQHECNYIDFKRDMYRREDNINLIKDIMSMANSDHKGYKCIIIGVKDDIANKREIVGVNEQIKDASQYQQLIHENIEPDINFSYLSDEIDGKKIAYFYIDEDNIDKPYMMKKSYNKLNQGEAWKRVNSKNQRLIRRDYDKFYSEKENSLKTKRDAYESEIKLMNVLSQESIYLFKKYNDITYVVKTFRELTNPREARDFKNFQNLSADKWKYLEINRLSKYSIKDLNYQLINDLINKIGSKYSEKYTALFSNIQGYHQDLKGIASELHRLNYQNHSYINEEIILNINLRSPFSNILNSDNIDVIGNPIGVLNKIVFMNNINYNDRYEELNRKINKIESNIK